MRRGRSSILEHCRAWIGLLLLPIPLVAPPLAAADSTPTPVEGWHSPALGLRLLPPAGWSLNPGPSADSILLAPRRGKAQIALLHLPLAGAAAETGLDAVVDDAVASLKAKVAGFKLLVRRPATVANLPAQEIYFRGKAGGEKYRWVQTIFRRGPEQVILMYTAPDATFTDYLGDYDQVVRSLTVLP